MESYAQLLDQLSYTSSTLDKRRLMATFFKNSDDPERGYALASLTGSLSFAAAKPALIRQLITERVDPLLYSLSRDYVGDMAETVALMWPHPSTPSQNNQPGLSEIVDGLKGNNRNKIKETLTAWLDALDTNGRWALLKLITGSIRVGVSARLAKLALADAFAVEINEIEQLWHGLETPYLPLFDWLMGKGAKPAFSQKAVFMPMMLSHPIEQTEFDRLDLSEFQIEMKWDGIRIQIVRAVDTVSLFTRTGDDISHTFPDVSEAILALSEDAFVVDGELLATKDGAIAPFNHLQQRLNRKKVTSAMLREYPTRVRLYDMLLDRGDDLRALPLSLRRKHLEEWHERNVSPAIDVSEIIAKPTHLELNLLREKARSEASHGVEGLMIKRITSPYLAGRPRGHWFKWKRNTLILDCVLMYAQRGSGKRSSFYSDYTFGVWQTTEKGRVLVPVGKAYSGFTDDELTAVDKWIRGNTTKRFGPVREVSPGLVLEIEFDSIHPSGRHKSGVALRFPRVHRIRWDKPTADADTLENAHSLIEA